MNDLSRELSGCIVVFVKVCCLKKHKLLIINIVNQSYQSTCITKLHVISVPTFIDLNTCSTLIPLLNM